MTAWAPPHTGKELRLARLGAFDAALGARRADAEAAAARKGGGHDLAGRHETLAASYGALRDHYQRREQILAQVMTDRQEWEHATAGSRRLALAADAELRRRYPGQKIEPLRSAEPTPATGIEREHLHPGKDGKPTETAAWIRDLAKQQRASRARIRNTRGWRSLGKIQSGATSARSSPADRHPAAMQYCSRPNRRSSHRGGSCSSPPSMTPNLTTKPRTEQRDRSSKKTAPPGHSAIRHPQPDCRSHHVTG